MHTVLVHRLFSGASGERMLRKEATVTTLQIDYPEEFLEQTTQTKADLEHLAREALVVRLYDLGKLSSSQAAQFLSITRWAFLDLLARYNVSYFDETMDVAAEAQHG